MKIFRYIALVFFFLLWVVGCQPELRRAAYQMGFIEDSYRYGDLYRFANLSQFKARTENCPKIHSKSTDKHAVNLYLIGDSFTESQRINADDFVARTYARIHWNESLATVLDTTQRNVLVLQTVERHFREHFAVPVNMLKVVHEKPIHSIESKSIDYWQEFRDRLKNSEEALVDVLFSSDFFLNIKEWKAALNLYFFNRTHDQVALSPDNQHILFSWDTDSTRITSSFKYLPDTELDTLIKNANLVRQQYLKAGFDEVYLAIVPNKTSIVVPQMGNYNHLVERVENHPNLQLPLISCWQYFNLHRSQVYAIGDTHWTCQGQQYWVQQVNEQLR